MTLGTAAFAGVAAWLGNVAASREASSRAAVHRDQAPAAPETFLVPARLGQRTQRALHQPGEDLPRQKLPALGAPAVAQRVFVQQREMFAESAEAVHDVKNQRFQQRRQRHARRATPPAPERVRRRAASEHLRKGRAKSEHLVTGAAGARRAGAWRIKRCITCTFSSAAGMRVHSYPKHLFFRRYSAKLTQFA